MFCGDGFAWWKIPALLELEVVRDAFVGIDRKETVVDFQGHAGQRSRIQPATFVAAVSGSCVTVPTSSLSLIHISEPTRPY